MLRVIGGKRKFLILETLTLILAVPVGQIYRVLAENIHICAIIRNLNRSDVDLRPQTSIIFV